MAVSWSNLPPEIWPIVFKHVESMQSLAECRLVCKIWDPLAERAMFSKPLSIRGQERIDKFYNRLQENPSLRYCIQSLSLLGFRHMTAAFKKDLLKLIMNPNIVYLDGNFDGTSLKYLVNAVEESEERCDKLEKLRTWEGDADDSYLEAQYYFRASLREFHLSMCEPQSSAYQIAINHFDQFSNLRRLALSYSDRHVLPELEQVLRQCQLLESIDTDISVGDMHWISKDELKQWMSSNVRKSPSLMIADVGEVHHPHLIEYLMFKYPNMRDITVSGAFTDDHGTIGRILDAVGNVDIIKLEFWYLDIAEEVGHVLSTLKNMNNVIIMNPCTSGYAMRSPIYLNAKKNKFENTTHCKICISETEFSTMLKTIIKDISSFQNLKVDYADEDVLLVENGPIHQGNTTFKRLIDILTIAMDVCFTCTYISLPSVPINALPFQRLETLKLAGAVIDQDVLTIISRATPKLKKLTLSTCILNPANSLQQYQIDMPHTDLDTLSITSGRSIWESYDDDLKDIRKIKYKSQYAAIKKISRKINIKQNQTVYVKMACLSSNLVEHYSLKPGTPAMTNVEA